MRHGYNPCMPWRRCTLTYWPAEPARLGSRATASRFPGGPPRVAAVADALAFEHKYTPPFRRHRSPVAGSSAVMYFFPCHGTSRPASRERGRPFHDSASCRTRHARAGVPDQVTAGNRRCRRRGTGTGGPRRRCDSIPERRCRWCRPRRDRLRRPKLGGRASPPPSPP